MRKNILKDNSGLSFAIVLLVILVLSILSMGLLNVLDFNHARTRNNLDRQEAYYISEGCVRRLSCQIDKVAASVITGDEFTPTTDEKVTAEESNAFFAVLKSKVEATGSDSFLVQLEKAMEEELGCDITLSVKQTKIVNHTGYYALSATCYYGLLESRTVTAEYKIPYDKTFEFEADFSVGEDSVIISSSSIINEGTIKGDYAAGSITGTPPIGNEAAAPTSVPELVITAAPQFDVNTVLDFPIPTLPPNVTNKYSSENWGNLFKDVRTIPVTECIATEYLLIDNYTGNGKHTLEVTKPDTMTEDLVFSMDRMLLNNTLTINVNNTTNPYAFYLNVTNFLCIEDGQELIINNGQNDVYLIFNEIFFGSTFNIAGYEYVPDSIDITVTGTGNVYFFYNDIKESYIQDRVKGPDYFVNYFYYDNKLQYGNFPMTVNIDSGDAPIYFIQSYNSKGQEAKIGVSTNEFWIKEGFSSFTVNYNGDEKLLYYLDNNMYFYCNPTINVNGNGNVDIVVTKMIELNSDVNVNIINQNVRVICQSKDAAFTGRMNGYDLNLESGPSGVLGIYLLGQFHFQNNSSTKANLNYTTEAEAEERKKHLDIYYYPLQNEGYQLFIRNYNICADFYICHNNLILENVNLYGSIFSLANTGNNEWWPEVNIKGESRVHSDLIYVPNGTITVGEGSYAESNVIANKIKVTQSSELVFSSVSSVKIPTVPTLKMNNGEAYNSGSFSIGFKEK